MNILICGGKGQLGSACKEVFKEKHQVIALGSKEMDIGRPAEVKKVLNSTNPSLILNCSAFAAVDECETERTRAWRVNVEGPRNLAQWAVKRDVKLVHISTDYVFDGKKRIPEPYTEKDEPNPASYYGYTKFEGEKVLEGMVENYAIVRTAWLYGVNGANFLKTMLRFALKAPQEQVKVVDDRFGSPTWAYKLALQVERLVSRGGSGVYHATSEGYCTWFGLAQYFLVKMKVPHSIVACTTEEFPSRAERPANSILENRRLKDEGINIMGAWERDVDEFVSRFGKVLMKEASSR